MANRQALEAAFKAADDRLTRLLPLMETYATDPLLDDGGKWSVRDCLSHVAASARVSGAGQRALDRLRNPAPAQPPAAGGPTLNERTQQHVTDRASKSVAEIAQETKDAHAAAWADIRAMSDADLDTKIPDAATGGRPAPSVGGLILRSLESHEGRQMDRIEDALRARTRWV